MNRLVDRRLLFECAVTHYATLDATAEQLDELDRLTHVMAKSTDWSGYHQADEQFHQLVGSASGTPSGTLLPLNRRRRRTPDHQLSPEFIAARAIHPRPDGS